MKLGGDTGAAGDPRSLGELAYHRLREAIRAGQLKPGDRMREVDLSRQLAMSRTPVREAMRRLESQGLLTYEPHRGMVVAELDHQSVIELYAMREVLEGAAAGLAARHASDAEIDIMGGLAAAEAATANDPDTLARQNRTFHEVIYRAAHNRYLLASLNALQDSMALLGETTLALPGRAEVAKGEHLAIVQAIRTHDPAAAEGAARAHIQSAYRARLRLRLGEAAPPEG